MAGEQGEENGRAAARPTLAERFHERRIRVDTMEVRLRAATAGAAAVLFAGAIFVALRGIHTVGVYLGESPQGVTSIPEPMFIATLVLTAVGFAYMLTGVALASPSVAIPSVALIVGGVGLYTGAFGSVIGGLDYFILLPAWARWSLRGILVIIALLAALAIAEGFRMRRQVPAVSDRALAGSVAAADQASTPAEAAERDGGEAAEGGAGEAAGGSPERSVRLAMLTATSILFGGYLLILRAASPTEGGLNEFGPLVGAILITLAIALYPILTVAAVDFAEWGQMASEFVTDQVQRNRARWVFHFSVLCAMGLVVYAYLLILPGRGVFSAGRVVHCLDALLLVAILLAVILGAGRLLGVHSRRWPESLNFAALAAVCAVTTVIVPPVAGRLSGELGLRSSPPLLEDGHYAPGADVVTLASTGNPPFSILVPRGWLPHRGPGQVIASDYFGGVQEVAAVQVPAGPLQAAVAGAKLTPSGPPTSSGPWEVQSGSSPGYKLTQIWETPAPVSVGGGDYLLILRSNLADPQASVPLFEAIAASFSPAGSPLATPPPAAESKGVPLSITDHSIVYGVLIELGLSLVLLLLVRLFGRRWPARTVGAVLLLGVVSVFATMFGLDSFGRVLFGAGARVSALGERGLELSLGVAALAALFLSRWAGPRWGGRRWDWSRRVGRRLPEIVIVLVGVTFTLDGTTRLYSGMLTAGRTPVMAAILVLLASAWDILMSGESMTNEGTPHMPRVTRVLAFFGYSILLSGMVLFYTAQKTVAGGMKVESLFEPEAITQGGLFRIALPVILLLLLLRLFGSSGETRPGTAPGPAGDGDQIEQPREGVMAMTGEE